MVDVSMNRLRGQLAEWIGHLPRLSCFMASRNLFEGKVPSSLSSNLVLKAKQLDLSCNEDLVHVETLLLFKTLIEEALAVAEMHPFEGHDEEDENDEDDGDSSRAVATLDFDQLEEGFKRLGHNVSEEEALSIFEDIDKEATGKLDFLQFAEACSRAGGGYSR